MIKKLVRVLVFSKGYSYVLFSKSVQTILILSLILTSCGYHFANATLDRNSFFTYGYNLWEFDSAVNYTRIMNHVENLVLSLIHI